MKLALTIAALALAGCATETPPSQVSNIDLCRYQWGGGHNGMVAQAEAQRRGLDCTPFYPAIAAQRAQAEAAWSQTLHNMANQNNGPAPPRAMNCNSYRLGNTVQTDCR